MTGSVHLGLRLLKNWPPVPQPFPIPSPLQIPSTQVKYAPYYDDFKNPASLVRNNNYENLFESSHKEKVEYIHKYHMQYMDTILKVATDFKEAADAHKV